MFADAHKLDKLMAIYHLNVQVISRSSGRSAVAAAAYRAGDKLCDERYNKTQDYERKQHIKDNFIRVPQEAPEWVAKRESLWNGVESSEKRKDAQLAREVEVALPRELDAAQQRALLEGFVDREFVSKGMVADVAIHEPQASDGETNPHAHIMLTTRRLTPEGFGPKERDWNRKDLLKQWREKWALSVNDALESGGFDDRIDHRSYKDQGIEKVPGVHLGPEPHQMERKGIYTQRGDALRRAEHMNHVQGFTAAQKGLAASHEAQRQGGGIHAFVMQQAAQINRMARKGIEAVKALPGSLIERFGGFVRTITPSPNQEPSRGR